MRLRLVRHAHADYERFRDTPQFTDPSLSVRGEAQLPHLVNRLWADPPGFVYCSPSLRTMATASAIAAGLGVRPVAWPEICEQGFLFGALGPGRSELMRRFPRIMVPEDIGEDGWAAGRTLEDDTPGSQRAHAVLDRLLACRPLEGADDVLLVTHLGFAGSVVRAILGVDRLALTMEDTAVTSFRLTDEVFLEYLNCTRHLPLK